MVESVWVGVDVGRHAHRTAAIDGNGAVVTPHPNDQAEIEMLFERVLDVESDRLCTR